MAQIKFGVTIALILVIGSFSQQINAQINCYTCGSTDANCLSDPTKAEFNQCSTGKCFTKSDAGKISRGCLAEGTTCTNPECFQCTTDKCNSNLICKNCASSSDPDCSQTEATKESYNSICSQKQTSCISLVRDDKHLERRCAKENEKCPNETTCSICPGANCNVGIYPPKRIRCYQCASTDTKCGDVNANSDTIKSKPCLLYNANEQCFTFGTSATTVTRGCSSDTDTNVNKCSQPDSTEACGVCSNDNCNNRAYQRDQLLKCVQCNSTTDANCLYNKKAEDAVNCKEKILYSQSDSCYMETMKDKKNLIRGCLYDRPAADGVCKSPECVSCNSGDGCNYQDTVPFSCIRCRSDLNAKCKTDVKDLGAECRNQNLTDTNKNCFTGIWNNVLIRGCLVDADARQQKVCADKDNKQCTACLGKDCNDVKSNASKTNSNIKIASSLLALVALFFWRLH